jgi:peptide/nickel transport system ATP-binding protein
MRMRRADIHGGWLSIEWSGMAALLEVEHLRTCFKTDAREVAVVDDISFSVDAGEVLALVGESGCGKSVTSLSIMGLLPKGIGRVAQGSIRFDGTDLLRLPQEKLRELRGSRIAMVFQEPMTSLNPAFTIGRQLTEALLCHRDIDEEEAQRQATDMLRRVGMPSPELRMRAYPHNLSGGMRQRVMIAMAMICSPSLLIADEPTTALDVTIQAQTLELMRALRKQTGTAIILVTHDLGVVAELADRVAVMYAGRIVETAPVADLYAEPQHPYTIGLLACAPRMEERRERFITIEGMVPPPAARPVGCAFAARCPFVIERCRAEDPPLMEIRPGQQAACWRAPLEGA